MAEKKGRKKYFSATIPEQYVSKYLPYRENSGTSRVPGGRKEGRERTVSHERENQLAIRGGWSWSRGGPGPRDFARQFISHYLRQCGYLGAKGRVRFKARRRERGVERGRVRGAGRRGAAR
ncbi:hypothetical protein WH47_02258 [Habropoda laboriosa]|uniref:Uncharacterized protein n=1 Tax=Habropoda laboriosa TaxID=597456 RepID=A0A0L7QZQ7_9HYME|nr:hypothetical protein WH47_02258 [Habropoda laboriosa]